MKILELIQDRKGKLSATKLSFLTGTFVFLSGWIYICIKTGVIQEVPTSISTFIGIIGANQLGQSYLKNKEGVTTITPAGTTTTVVPPPAT